MRQNMNPIGIIFNEACSTEQTPKKNLAGLSVFGLERTHGKWLRMALPWCYFLAGGLAG